MNNAFYPVNKNNPKVNQCYGGGNFGMHVVNVVNPNNVNFVNPNNVKCPNSRTSNMKLGKRVANEANEAEVTVEDFMRVINSMDSNNLTNAQIPNVNLGSGVTNKVTNKDNVDVDDFLKLLNASNSKEGKKLGDLSLASEEHKKFLDSIPDKNQLENYKKDIGAGKNAEKEIGKGSYGKVLKGAFQDANGAQKSFVHKRFNVNDFAAIASEIKMNEILTEETRKIKNSPVDGPGKDSRENTVYDLIASESIVPLISSNVSSGQSSIYYAAGPETTLETSKFISPEASLRTAVCIVNAVYLLHKAGIIHKDLKPANILVDPTGLAKVIDLGSSVNYRDNSKQRERVAAQAYCGAPEQFSWAKSFSSYGLNLDPNLDPDLVEINNPKLDIYGLGMMLFGALFDNKVWDIARHFLYGGELYMGQCYSRPEPELIAEGMIPAISNLYNNIDKIINYAQQNSPFNGKYTDEQIKGFKFVIKWCMNPFPNHRPTAYQVGEFLEYLAAGCSVETAKEFAFKGKHSYGDGSLTQKTIASYKKLGRFSGSVADSCNPYDKDSDVVPPSTASETSSADQPQNNAQQPQNNAQQPFQQQQNNAQFQNNVQYPNNQPQNNYPFYSAQNLYNQPQNNVQFQNNAQQPFHQPQNNVQYPNPQFQYNVQYSNNQFQNNVQQPSNQPPTPVLPEIELKQKQRKKS